MQEKGASRLGRPFWLGVGLPTSAVSVGFLVALALLCRLVIRLLVVFQCFSEDYNFTVARRGAEKFVKPPKPLDLSAPKEYNNKQSFMPEAIAVKPKANIKS